MIPVLIVTFIALACAIAHVERRQTHPERLLRQMEDEHRAATHGDPKP